MFLNKKKKSGQNPKTATDSETAAQLNGDLIVHNMPSQAKLSGSGGKARTPLSTSFASVAAPKHNFKSVGLIIIGGGFIFIAGLIYLSYHFIISPTAGQNITAAPVVTVAETNITSTGTPPTSPVVVPDTTAVATLTPTILDLATTTATTSDAAAGQTVSNLPPLVDSDNDGLSDDEEAVLGTSASSSDSNGNSYPDLTEINNNYNPAAAGRLEANSNLAKYSNSTIGYEILYPKNWPIQSLNNDATVTFTLPDGSLIQISVQDNPDQAGILSWYENLFPEVTVAPAKLKSAATWDGVMGEDNLNFYLTDKKHDNIFVISYISAVDGRVAYPNIFKLMIDSLVLK